MNRTARRTTFIITFALEAASFPGLRPVAAAPSTAAPAPAVSRGLDPMTAPAIRRTLLEERPVEGVPGLLTQVWLIEYPPGASAPSHHHPVVGIGYVVQGAFDSAFGEDPVARVSAGQSFVDPPRVEHRLFRNASATEPLKFVMSYSIPRGTPIVELSRRVQLQAPASSVVIAAPGLYPETLEVNPVTKQFLVGSLREGAVYGVGRDGSVRPLVQDDRLTAVLGIAVDPRDHRLLVTNSDLGISLRRSAQGAKHQAAVGIYDLASGRPLHYADLTPLSPGAEHLINGITVDGAGTAYATDSFSPVIYAVDHDGRPRVFLESDEFRGPGINLNGIVSHPAGFLIAVKKSTGALYRIPLARPRDFARVRVSGNFTGGDGLALVADDQLVLIANKTPALDSQTAFVLRSQDGWATAEVVDSRALGNDYPTTCVALEGRLYALSSQLDEWLGAAAGQRPALLARGRRGEIRQIGIIQP